MPVFVRASSRARAYVRGAKPPAFKRTPTEKALKARHDRHQKLIKYKLGSERVPPLPKRGAGKLKRRY